MCVRRGGHRAQGGHRALGGPRGSGGPCLGEEVDAVGDGVHGDGVAPDEEAPEVDPGEAVQPGVQAGQLADVVADHVQQTLGDVLLGELCSGIGEHVM